MELAPPLFGAASTILADQTLDTCRFILETFKALWRSAEPTFKCDSDESSDKLIAFARQCMLYFPFGSSVLGACDSQVNAVLLEMNLAVSELVSLIVTAVESSDPKIIRERQRWKSRVTNYVLTLLGAKQRGDGGTCSMVANLQSGQVVDLLLTLWKLCKDGSKKDQKLLLESFIRYTHACNVFSESKAIAIEFLALIVK
ncbi:rRNA processing protein, partial [Spiromyces aspiralis]